MTNASELSSHAGRDALVVISSVACIFEDDTVWIDDKLHSGLLRYLEEWGGPLVLLTPLADIAGPYATAHPRAKLPYAIVPFDLADQAVSSALSNAGVVLASADDHRQLSVWRCTARPVIYVIEYTLGTRIQQIRVSRSSFLRKAKSLVWTMLQERHVRRALHEGAAMQCNGTPTFAAYGRLNPDSLLYFDTRMSARMMITEDALSRKLHALKAANPLRLAYSGRLETIKGAHHLVTIARALRTRNVRFTFDIYGTGSLFAEMDREIQEAGLEEQVRLHGAVDFADELVPRLCQAIDLFVCCHLQDDPSCTYLETLGCGVPIAGYRNLALEGVLGLGAVGAITGARTAASMASLIVELDADRARLASLMRTATQVGRDHSFERVFAGRVRQIRAVGDRAQR